MTKSLELPVNFSACKTHQRDSMMEKPRYDAPDVAWLWSTCDEGWARNDVWLPFTLANERAPCVYATWECSVHEFVVHFLLVLLSGYGFA